MFFGSPKLKKLLFVCLGNICRSPSAEGVMAHLIKKEGLEGKIKVDSAGMIGFHAGEQADPRSRKHAEKRGVEITSIARQFRPNDDFHGFDYILAMDKKNLSDLKNLDKKGEFAHKIFMMTDFCRNKKVKEVPDPYYLGANGFELVLDILEDSCVGLLDKIKQEI
ncbi:MAG: low molecular weight phosphotyrosine protein phosphatase [Epsilonproteobacteria bacterium]|nr:MAG: low molecular weight phosphotyrosine protein phosphatase [Campylobacterota bacterium]